MPSEFDQYEPDPQKPTASSPTTAGPSADLSLDDSIDQIADHFQVPRDLWRSMVGKESGGNVNVGDSQKGARGLFQIMPATAANLKKPNGQAINPKDPIEAAYGGLKLLSDNYKKFRPMAQNDRHAWGMAIAGYHGNPSNVEKDIKRGGTGIPDQDDGGINTQDHVYKILKNAPNAGRQPSNGVTPPAPGPVLTKRQQAQMRIAKAKGEAPPVPEQPGLDFSGAIQDARAGIAQSRTTPDTDFTGGLESARAGIDRSRAARDAELAQRTDEFAPAPSTYAAEQGKFSQIDTVGRQAVDLMARQRAAQVAQQRAVQQAAARRAEAQRRIAAAKGLATQPSNTVDFGNAVPVVAANQGEGMVPRAPLDLPGRDTRNVGQILTQAAESPEADIRRQIRAQVERERAPLEAIGLPTSHNPITAIQGLISGETYEDTLEKEVEKRYQAHQRSQTPEMIAARKEFGDLSPAGRAVLAPLARAGGGILKLVGGVAGLGGLTPNQFSEYANARGAFAEESASLPPLTAEGAEVVRRLPEKALSAVADLGLSIAEVVLLKKATGLSMGRLLALETTLKTSDLPVDERAAQVAESFAMGKVLDSHLSRPASAALFGAPTALHGAQSVAQGNKTLEDALLETGIQTAAGAILGGKGPKEIPQVAAEIGSRAPVTPEWLRTRIAERGGLGHVVLVEYGAPAAAEGGKSLAKRDVVPTGRALSVYADPALAQEGVQSGGLQATKIPGTAAEAYGKRGIQRINVTPEEYQRIVDASGSRNPTQSAQIAPTPPSRPQIPETASPRTQGPASPLDTSAIDIARERRHAAELEAQTLFEGPQAGDVQKTEALAALDRANKAGDGEAVKALTTFAQQRGASIEEVNEVLTKPSGAITPPAPTAVRAQEAPETVSAHLEAAYQGLGGRKAMILTEGNYSPEQLANIPSVFEYAIGPNKELAIFNPEVASKAEVQSLLDNGETHKLTGMPNGETPEAKIAAVARVADGPNKGQERWAGYLIHGNEDAFRKAAAAQNPNETLSFEFGGRETEKGIIAQRLSPIDDIVAAVTERTGGPEGLLGTYTDEGIKAVIGINPELPLEPLIQNGLIQSTPEGQYQFSEEIQNRFKKVGVPNAAKSSEKPTSTAIPQQSQRTDLSEVPARGVTPPAITTASPTAKETPSAGAEGSSPLPASPSSEWEVGKVLSEEESQKLVREIRAGDARSKNQGEGSLEPPTGRLKQVELPVADFAPEYIEYLRESTNADRVTRYAAEKPETPIYATPGRRGGNKGKWTVSDGGHRLLAAIERGDTTIRALVPADEKAERVEFLEQKLEDMGAAEATFEGTPHVRQAAIADTRKALEQAKAEEKGQESGPENATPKSTKKTTSTKAPAENVQDMTVVHSGIARKTKADKLARAEEGGVVKSDGKGKWSVLKPAQEKAHETEEEGRGPVPRDRATPPKPDEVTNAVTADNQTAEATRVSSEMTPRPALTWRQFPKSLGLPRAAMPQIDNAHRGAMVQYLKGRGIDWSIEQVKPTDLKPSQAEYSPEKVEESRQFAKDNPDKEPRKIIVSSDNHVIDAHHQWERDLEDEPGTPIPIIRLHAPANVVMLELAHFPSSYTKGSHHEAGESKEVSEDADSGRSVTPTERGGDEGQEVDTKETALQEETESPLVRVPNEEAESKPEVKDLEEKALAAYTRLAPSMAPHVLEKNAKRMARVIAENVVGDELLAPKNKTSRQVYEEITGRSLPKGEEATRKFEPGLKEEPTSAETVQPHKGQLHEEREDGGRSPAPGGDDVHKERETGQQVEPSEEPPQRQAEAKEEPKVERAPPDEKELSAEDIFDQEFAELFGEPTPTPQPATTSPTEGAQPTQATPSLPLDDYRAEFGRRAIVVLKGIKNNQPSPEQITELQALIDEANRYLEQNKLKDARLSASVKTLAEAIEQSSPQAEKIPVDESSDPNIGRTWNSPYGKQTITKVEHWGGQDHYTVATEGSSDTRSYSQARIGDVIKENERALTPEYAAEQERLKEGQKAAKIEAEGISQALANEGAKIDRYLDTTDLSPMQRGKVKTTLLQQAGKDASGGEVYRGSRASIVERMVTDGYQPKSEEADAIKPLSRTQFNRMDNRQQDAYEKRKKEAGKKTEYQLADPEGRFFVVTKAEHDYAEWIAKPASKPFFRETDLTPVTDTQKAAPEPEPEAAADTDTAGELERTGKATRNGVTVSIIPMGDQFGVQVSDRGMVQRPLFGKPREEAIGEAVERLNNLTLTQDYMEGLVKGLEDISWTEDEVGKELHDNYTQAAGAVDENRPIEKEWGLGLLKLQKRLQDLAALRENIGAPFTATTKVELNQEVYDRLKLVLGPVIMENTQIKPTEDMFLQIEVAREYDDRHTDVVPPDGYRKLEDAAHGALDRIEDADYVAEKEPPAETSTETLVEMKARHDSEEAALKAPFDALTSDLSKQKSRASRRAKKDELDNQWRDAKRKHESELQALYRRQSDEWKANPEAIAKNAEGVEYAKKYRESEALRQSQVEQDRRAQDWASVQKHGGPDAALDDLRKRLATARRSLVQASASNKWKYQSAVDSFERDIAKVEDLRKSFELAPGEKQPEVSKAAESSYDRAYAAYKRTLPSISDSVLKSNAERMARILENKATGKDLEIIGTNNKSSRKIFKELTDIDLGNTEPSTSKALKTLYEGNRGEVAEAPEDEGDDSDDPTSVDYQIPAETMELAKAFGAKPPPIGATAPPETMEPPAGLSRKQKREWSEGQGDNSFFPLVARSDDGKQEIRAIPKDQWRGIKQLSPGDYYVVEQLPGGSTVTHGPMNLESARKQLTSPSADVRGWTYDDLKKPVPPVTDESVLDDAAAALAEFFPPTKEAPEELLSTEGGAFNEELYAKIKPVFTTIAKRFQTEDAPKESLRPLMRHLAGPAKWGKDQMMAMRPYLVRFTNDLEAGLIDLQEAPDANITQPQGDGETSTEGPTADAAPATTGNGKPGRVGTTKGGSRAGGTGRSGRTGTRTGSDVDTRTDTADQGPEHEEQAGGRDSDSAGDRTPARGVDYLAPEGSLRREGSWRETASRNLDILELVKRLQSENRLATPEEQAQIVKFTGWGASEIANNLFPGVAQYGDLRPYLARDPTWRGLVERVEELFTPEELKSATSSTQYAHYTSEKIIRGIWDGIERLGFQGGKMLEPGMGIGLFAVAAPADVMSKSRYTGIERESLTAAIAAQVLQNQAVIAGDYVKQKLPDNFFDIVFGNPPFAKTKILDDPKYKKFRFALHDYFFAKSMDKVRPGGLMIFVTSRYTMDKGDDKLRRFIDDRADLMGAIRLPQTAFLENAGTEVVTDVLFFRKRSSGEEAHEAAQPWMERAGIDVEGQPELINEYYAAHPEMVLGTHSLSGTMYAAKQYAVSPKPGDIEEQFVEAVQNLPVGVYAKQSQSESIVKQTAERDWNPATKKEGSVYIHADGTLRRVESGSGVVLSDVEALSPASTKWLKDYVGLRTALKQAQFDQLNDGPWEQSLIDLNTAYDAFVKKNGRVLDFTTTERTITDDDGIEQTRLYRRYKNNKLLGMDIESPLVEALERINEDGEIVKAPILKVRQIKPPTAVEVKTISDALAVSLDQLGTLNLDHVTQLMQPVQEMTKEEVIAELGEAIYEAPGGTWQTADEYLSGYVIDKLEEVEAAAQIEPRFKRNIEALLKVQPRPLEPANIGVSLGAAWIPDDKVSQFAQEVLEFGPDKVKYQPLGNVWLVRGAEGGGSRSRRNAAETWGTGDRSPSELLDAALNGQTVKVYRELEKGKKELDKDASAAANDIIKKMRESFRRWLWTDAERTLELTARYNRQFNNIAPRQFNGKHLRLPGLSAVYQLYEHQLRVVWRILQSGNTYLAHSVGAGKTLEMIVSAMEQRRLGLISKPMFIVPNHMLKQFSSEFIDAYPLARILVADEKSFSKEKRQRFVAQAALNDLDAVILTHSAFGLIRTRPETAEVVVRDTVDQLRAAIDAVEEDSEMAAKRKIKRLEQRIEQIERRFASRQSDERTDDVVNFEDLGVDFIYTDEAHTFRKLDFVTNHSDVKGVTPEGSRRALDLLIKMKWLNEQRPGRSAVLASGTPVTNTLAELYSIQRFLDPEELATAGLDHFDAWASQFGDVVGDYEMNAAGSYELVERFSRFINIPELMKRVRKFMDVLTLRQLGGLVDLPTIKGGRPEVVVVPATDETIEYLHTELANRIEVSRKWKPSRDQPGNPDPLINIITDGRLAAIDMRFVKRGAENNPDSKLNKMIDSIIEHYKADAANEYLNTLTGEIDPIKGAAQIVFSAVGFGEQVAINRGFDAKRWMLKRMTEAGIPANEIAFMSDYKNATAKEQMFKEMRQGKKRILIGSPQNMGTGLNVQKRLKVLHFLSPPWYPADVEQPDGRIMRQGNQHTEPTDPRKPRSPSAGQPIEILRYATKGTYDSTAWSMIARKSRAIEQAMMGDDSQRTLEDITESSQYEMASALAAGDARAIKLASLRREIEGLTRLEGGHAQEQSRLYSAKRQHESGIEYANTRIEKYDRAIAAVGDERLMPDEFFATTKSGQRIEKRKEIGEAIKADWIKKANEHRAQAIKSKKAVYFELDAKVLGKFPLLGWVDAGKYGVGSGFSVKVADTSERLTDEFVDKIDEKVDATGLGTRIYNALNGFAGDKRSAEQEIEGHQRELKQVKSKLGAPFEGAAELYEKIAELSQLQREMSGEADIAPIPPTIADLDQETYLAQLAKWQEGNRQWNLETYGTPEQVIQSFTNWFDQRAIEWRSNPSEENQRRVEDLVQNQLYTYGDGAKDIGGQKFADKLSKYWKAAKIYSGKPEIPQEGTPEEEPPEIDAELSRAPAGWETAGAGPVEKPEFTAEGNKITLNAAGRSLMSDVLRNGGVKMGATGAAGAFVKNPENFALGLERLAEADPARAEDARAFAQVVRDASKETGTVRMAYGHPQAMHEGVHEASFEGSGRQAVLKDRHTPEGRARLVARPEWQTIEDTLVEKGYPLHEGTLIEESAAHLMSGDLLGLTQEQAFEWMQEWYRSFVEKGGNISSLIFKEITDEAERARAIVYAETSASTAARDRSDDGGVQGVSDRGRTSAEEGYGETEGGVPGETTEGEVAPDVVSFGRQIDTPEFRKWFGDSKVVDENGEPLVVYHGTVGDFSVFDKQKIGSTFGYDKEGFFFTNETADMPGSASQYGEGGSVIPAYLRIVKPYTLADYAEDADTTVHNLTHYAGDPQAVISLFDENREEIIALAKNRGSDGVVFEHSPDGLRDGLYIAFEPTQIKSAIGNRGAFDPDNPDILMALEGPDIWAHTIKMMEDLQRRVGQKRRKLPGTFEAAGMEKGTDLFFDPTTIAVGVERGRQVLAEKGLDGAIEFIRNGEGIEWASVGYAVLEQMRADEAGQRLVNPTKADEIAEKRLTVLNDFVSRSTTLGQTIAGIMAISEFAPDRAAMLLNKLSWKVRGEGISVAEEAKITDLANQLMAAMDRNKSLEDNIAYRVQVARELEDELEAEKRRARRREEYKSGEAKDRTRPTLEYEVELNEQAEAIKEDLITRVGNLNFGNLKIGGSKGIVLGGGLGFLQTKMEKEAERYIRPLPGDAELLAQYAASQLSKLETAAELNEHMTTTFGAEVEPYLPAIRQRAFQIRLDARRAELAAEETPKKRRRTILSEIQAEITAARKMVTDLEKAHVKAEKERQKAEEASRKEAAAATKRAEEAVTKARDNEMRKAAQAELRRARELERQKGRTTAPTEAQTARKERLAQVEEAKQRKIDAQKEYAEAAKSENKGWRESIRAQKKAARTAALWDTPLRDAAIAAQDRLEMATDAGDPQVMEDLVSVTAAKWLPDTPGGPVRTKAVDPSQIYVDLKDAYPNLVTKKNQREIYRRAYQRIQDATNAARAAAKIRSVSKESKELWEKLGVDTEAQALLIERARVQREQQEIRQKMREEFDRVSRTPVRSILHEVGSLPRALQSSIDAPLFRQGILLAITHPLETLRYTVPAIGRGYTADLATPRHLLQLIVNPRETWETKPWRKGEFQEDVMELESHPHFEVARLADLDLPKLMSEADKRIMVEEDFQSAWGEKFPHVRLSEQGFILGMNTARLIAFSRMAAMGEANGYTWENNPLFFRQAAALVNAMTGRANMPDLVKRISGITNMLYYSTRLNMSRMQVFNQLFNPVKYLPSKRENWRFHDWIPFLGGKRMYNPFDSTAGIGGGGGIGEPPAPGAEGTPQDKGGWGGRGLKAFDSHDPVMRRIMVNELLRGLAMVAGFYILCRLLGLSIELDDEDSANWGKVRAGNTRYDVTGGHATTLRYMVRFYKGMREQLTLDKKDRDPKHHPGRIFWEFNKYKFAPWAGFGYSVIEGEDVIGQPANFKVSADMDKMMSENIILKLVEPMVLGDFAEGIALDGWLGGVKTIPALGGMGVQTYPFKQRANESEAQKLLYRRSAAGGFGNDEPEDKERRMAIRQFEDDIRAGKKVVADIEAAVQKGLLKPDDPQTIARDAQLTTDQLRFKRASIEDALDAFEVMNPEERAAVKDILISKGPAIKNLRVTEQEAIRKRFEALTGTAPATRERRKRPVKWLQVLRNKESAAPSPSPTP